jgi:hypothetical protein
MRRQAFAAGFRTYLESSEADPGRAVNRTASPRWAAERAIGLVAIRQIKQANQAVSSHFRRSGDLLEYRCANAEMVRCCGRVDGEARS